MKFGDREWYAEQLLKEKEFTKTVNYKDQLRVLLSLPIKELKGTPLYNKIKSIYKDIDENITVAELRTMKLLEKVFIESSQKSLDLTYKLDGSMADLTVELDFADIDDAIGGIK